MTDYHALIEKLEAQAAREVEMRRDYLSRLGFDWTRTPKIDVGGIASNPLSLPANVTIALETGRTITLREVHQGAVYEGTLAGVPPTPEDDLVATMRTAQRLFPELTAFMIEPVLHTATLATRSGSRSYPYPLIWLPPVCTVGRFVSAPVERDDAADYSALVIVWFQQDFGMPSDDIQAHLRKVDWDHAAVDFDR